MKRKLFNVPVLGASVVALFGAILANTANAGVTSCVSKGTLPSGSVLYAECSTDANNGSGKISFSPDGSSVELQAQTVRSGLHQVAASWSSNGPVQVSDRVCVKVEVRHLFLPGNASAQQQLILSYNGAQQQPLVSPVSMGKREYCATVPAGATNVWWQLITLVSVDRPRGLAFVSQTLKSFPPALYS